MFTGSMLAIIVVVFLIVLLLVAIAGEKFPLTDTKQQIVYSLALGIHCTTWAMFGTISQASDYGWSLIPTYLGMILAMVLGFYGLKKVAQLSIQHNIASLADFMSIRFNQSFGLPALITLVCVVGVTPYIALQLDSISSTAQILLPSSTLVTDNVNWFVALSMAAFALFFGTRSKSLSPKHPGLLLLVAFTSIVKLLAMGAMTLWVCYGLFDGVYDLFRQAVAHPIANQSLSHDFAWSNYSVYVFLGVVSMFCLPRQFHMTFVELPQLQALHTARWILPLYLLCMSIGVLPIALAGNIILAPQGVSTDSFTIALPLYANQSMLTILAFIGGLAAAMAMIIVSTLALGIMIGNNIATPLYFLIRQKKATHQQIVQLHGSTILWLRRATVVAVLIGAYFYHIHISQTMPLVNSGFIAIALIAQLFPSFVLNTALPRPPVLSPILAIVSGALAWFGLILLPSIGVNPFSLPLANDEQQAFALLYSLLINISLYMLVYTLTQFSPLFTRLGQQKTTDDASQQSTNVTNYFIRQSELVSLCQRLLPGRNVQSIFDNIDEQHYVSHEQIDHALALVANQVGFPTAKLLFNAIADTPENRNEMGDWITQTQVLTQARDSAERANELKTKFLAAAGHDLMQPFNAAQLFAAVIAEKNQDLRLTDATTGLVKSLDNAENLLTMLIDMTKLESGVITPNHQSFGIDDIISPLVAEFSIIAQQANIQLHYVVSKQVIISDKLLLKRIIQNLLSNAIRYTSIHHHSLPNSKNKVLIGVRIKASQIQVWVCDTGPGIPKDKQTLIFNEFAQLSPKTNQLGLGLGLTIVEKMALLLDHPLALDSEVGRGTRFSVTLPRVNQDSFYQQQRKRKQNHAQPIANAQASSQTQLRVLLIENDEQIANAMLSTFAAWGYSAKWVSNSEQAQALLVLEGFAPNLIICDYHLDFGITGIAVYLAIQAHLSSRHIAVLTTADRSVDIRDTASELGMYYLPKPIKPVALKHILKRRGLI